MRLSNIFFLLLFSATTLSAQNFVNFPYTFGVISVGGTNANYATITTDRLRFIMDKQMLVKTGRIGSYGTTQDLLLTTHLTTRATILATNGSFGINTATPLGMMHVRNTTAALPGLYVEQSMTNATGMQIKMADNIGKAIVVRQADSTHFQVMNDGRVFAREIEVKLGAFPDYVFAPDYTLMSLPLLKAFIAQHRRLPNMPSAVEVAQNGVGLGELARLQTEKIEELTLHVIALNERIALLEQQNLQFQAQQAQLNLLAKQVEAIQLNIKN